MLRYGPSPRLILNAEYSFICLQVFCRKILIQHFVEKCSLNYLNTHQSVYTLGEGEHVGYSGSSRELYPADKEA